MSDDAQREAFDLFQPACWWNFKKGLKRGKWRYIWFWKMVISDTYNRVCSRRNP